MKTSACAARVCWPELLTTNLGNGRPFVRGERLPQAAWDEFSGFRYDQEGCVSLLVFND